MVRNFTIVDVPEVSLLFVMSTNLIKSVCPEGAMSCCCARPGSPGDCAVGPGGCGGPPPVLPHGVRGVPGGGEGGGGDLWAVWRGPVWRGMSGGRAA